MIFKPAELTPLTALKLAEIMAEAGVPAAEGGKMACGNDMLNFSQCIGVKKGVPVKISFKARALPIKD